MEAVAYHATPSDCVGIGFNCLTAVHLANVLARQGATDTDSGELVETSRGFDLSYLESEGLSTRLAEWRKASLAQLAGEHP